MERASGIGYEGPRIRKISADDDNLLIREETKTPGQVDFNQERPSNNIFLESSREQDERVRANSPFRHLRTWKLMKIIVKSNDDVRQE
jgi:hypothetical protein